MQRSEGLRHKPHGVRQPEGITSPPREIVVFVRPQELAVEIAEASGSRRG